MTNLSALQRDFQAFILHGDSAALQTLSARSRPEIYAGAYIGRLTEVLAADYEVLARILGEDAFDSLARDYIAAHPSKARSARHFGAELPDFLDHHPLAKEYPPIADMARFEKALADAFDAEDADILSIADMAAIEPGLWPRLTFTFHPSVNRLELQHKVDGAWSGDDVEAGEPTRYLIWRQDLVSMYRALDREAESLALAMAGASFGDICLAVDQNDDPQMAAQIAATYLRTWIEHGLIIQATP